MAPGEVSGHLVEAGPKLWSPLPQESSPLFKAIVQDNEQAVAALLADSPEQLDEPLTLLYWAADPKAAAEAGGRASVQVRQRTPLHLSAQCGSMGVLALLLHKGANVLAKASGQTALEVALETENPSTSSIVELLKQATARRLQQEPAPTPSAPQDAASDREAPAAFNTMDLAVPHRRGPQAVEGDASNPEGFPYSTTELTMPEYSTDSFRMYQFKVTRCSKKYTHDWRSCPFAHPTENARRRDPREYRYCSIACPDYKQGFCIKGDACEYAHGVFEGWLHPARYRTQLCKDGANCHRPVCFFAHCLSELRTPTNTWTPDAHELSAAGVVAPPSIALGGAPGPQAHASSKATSESAPEALPAKAKGHPASPASVMAYDELDIGAGGFLDMGEGSRAKAEPDALPGYSAGSHGGASSSEASAASGYGAGQQGAATRGTNRQQQQQQRQGQSQGQGQGQGQLPRGRPVGPLISSAAISAAARGEVMLGFTTPRMSNSFARRHGLNPKDNAMLNLQKLAIQAQAAGSQQIPPRWGEEAQHGGGYQGKQGYRVMGGQGNNRQALWQGSGQQLGGMPPHGGGMYGMGPMPYGGGMGHGMMPSMHGGSSTDTAAASVSALNQSLMALGLQHPHQPPPASSMAAFASGMPLNGAYGGYGHIHGAGASQS